MCKDPKSKNVSKSNTEKFFYLQQDINIVHDANREESSVHLLDPAVLLMRTQNP